MLRVTLYAILEWGAELERGMLVHQEENRFLQQFTVLLIIKDGILSEITV